MILIYCFSIYGSRSLYVLEEIISFSWFLESIYILFGLRNELNLYNEGFMLCYFKELNYLKKSVIM